ncbi:hypothetical protein Tco_1125711 [Tanacetum coccineum]
MLQFLSNSSISTALTKQPSAYYSKYLREFWYTAEVDVVTKSISFTLSGFDKPISFTSDEFSSIIGLNYSEIYVPLPSKEMVRYALATLGLVDENDTSISSTHLVNSSSLKMRYFSPIWRAHGFALWPSCEDFPIGHPYQYYFHMSTFNCTVPENPTRSRPQNALCHCKAHSFTLWPSCEDFPVGHSRCGIFLGCHTLFPPSGDVNVDDIADKESSSSPRVTDTQPAKEPEATVDATQSIDASESAEELRNHPKTADAIKSLKKFIGKEVPTFKYDDSQINDGIEIPLVDSDLEFMPGDEIKSLYGFEEAETDDDTMYVYNEEFSKDDENADDNVIDELVDLAKSKDSTANASAAKPTQSDPIGYHPADFSSLVATIQNLKSSFDFVKKALPKLDKRVKKTLKAQVLELIIKLLNKELDALNTLENNRIVDL